MTRVNVISGGDFAASSVLYRPVEQNVIDYFTSNLQDVTSRIKDIDHSFYQTMTTMYNNNYSKEALDASRLLLNRTNMALDYDVIVGIPYEYIPMANPYMQNYIMSQPDLNLLYQKNSCYGFQETYIDPEPDTYGKDRIIYQQVMDGVLQFDKSDEGLGYINHYSNSFEEELTTIEKFSILDLWDDVKRYIANGKDPSDPIN